MEKEVRMNRIQRGFAYCCILFVAMMALLANVKEVKAADGSEDRIPCQLKSITLEIEGKEYKFQDYFETFVVDKDTDWYEFLSSIKIVDFELISNDLCACENHDVLEGELFGVYGEDDYFLRYDNGVTTNLLQEDPEIELASDLVFELYFTNEWGDINVGFTKEYSITYDLNGGSFPEGMEVPMTYNSFDTERLPVPEREGYIFTGWTISGNDASVIEKWTGGGEDGDVLYIAHWEEGERIDISSSRIEVSNNNEYTGDAKTPTVRVYYQESEDSEEVCLEMGRDYSVSYKNNIEVADANGENPPTFIVRGIGVYKGIIERPFTITKGDLYADDRTLFVAKDEALSTIDMSFYFVYTSWAGERVEGTWVWSEPDRILDVAVGETAQCEATFIPTDIDHYNVLKEKIYVGVKEAISSCKISFVEKADYMYTGVAYKPEVTVTCGEKTLVEETDYRVFYKNNVNAGNESDENAPAIIVKGMGDYAGAKTIFFTIAKADVYVKATPEAGTIDEGMQLSDSLLTGGKVTDAKGNELKGTFAWKDGAIVPTVADSGVTKHVVVFTPDDSNYKSVEMTVIVTVNKKEETTTPQPDEGQGEQQQEIQIKIGDKIVDGTATYVVSELKDGKVSLTYVKPMDKTKTMSIPATVTLADGTKAKVTSIAAKAFKKNTKLQEVTIGKNIKSIGNEAFSGCKKLKKVKGAKNVTSIGKSAFQGCSKLKTINIKTTKLTKKNVKKNAFKGIHSKAKIDVPNSKLKAYKSMLKARGVGKNATIK